MLFKNVAGQKVHVFAYNNTTGAPVTGDAANITGYVSLDGTANAIDDTNPTEVDATNMPGLYVFDLTQAETNGDGFALYAKSTTANVVLDPIVGFTQAGAIPKIPAGADGGLPTTNGSKLNQTVDLTNGAMGGSSLVLTVKQLIINNSAGIAVDIDGTTTGIAVNASAGSGMSITAGGMGANALELTGVGAGSGLAVIGGDFGPGAYIAGAIGELDIVGRAIGGGLAVLLDWNPAWDAEVESEVNDALVALKLDHLLAVADGDDVADGSVVAKLAAKGGTADWSTFANTTDSLEAIRDTPPLGTAMRGTDNAALASVCTEARLAKLGVTGTLANTDNADSFKATGFAVAGDAMALTAGAQSSLVSAIEVELANDATGQQLMQAIADKLAAEFDIEELGLATIAVACRDAILDRVLAGNHDTAGTPGKLLQTVYSGTPPTVEQIRSEIDSNSTQLATIAADVAGLDGAAMRGTDGANTIAPDNTSIAAIKLQTDKLAFAGTGPYDVKATLDSESVTVGVNSDKTGYSLVTAPPTTTEIKTAMEVAGGHLALILDDTGTTLPGLIAGIEGGAGTGARTVTIIVQDADENPLENARVRMTNGAESYVGATDASGQVVFALDDGTWAVAVTKPLYTFTPTTLAVSADLDQIYFMTALSIPVSEPDKVTGYTLCLDEQGEPEEDVEVQLWQTATPTGGTGYAYDKTVRAATSDGNGLAFFAGMIPGAGYRLRRGSGSGVAVAIAADATGTVALPSLLGKE